MTDLTVPAALLGDVRTLIDRARQRVATSVNRELVMLNWSIGERLHREVLDGRRADYGKQIVATLSRQLAAAYGRGFSASNLQVHAAPRLTPPAVLAMLPPTHLPRLSLRMTRIWRVFYCHE